jgi:methyltransferase
MTLTRLEAFEILVVAAALQRLGELWHSRRNLRRQGAASPADSRANWVALVAIQSAWLAGCALEVAWRGRVPAPGPFAVGLGLFGAGEALRVWCIVTLGRAWNARARVAADQTVVTGGPYRWIRHPNYLGVFLELVGLPLAGGAWITLAVLFPLHVVVFVHRIRGEDRLLLALPGYAEHMAGKGALLPRLGARRVRGPRP